jgi:hypothetical protein
MATDATIRYGASRKAEPLTDREQDRLRQLAGRGRLSPTESYELGALKGRARHDPAGRRLLDDVGHDQAARRQPGRPVTARQASRMVSDAVRQHIARALEDAEW